MVFARTGVQGERGAGQDKGLPWTGLEAALGGPEPAGRGGGRQWTQRATRGLALPRPPAASSPEPGWRKKWAGVRHLGLERATPR